MFEKVNPAHPDKIADRIAGALVDLAYAKHESPRIAAEVLIGHGRCFVIVETSEQILEPEVRAIVDRIAGPGLSLDFVYTSQDRHLAANQDGAIRCGDNGIFTGVPVQMEENDLAALVRDLYEIYPTDGKFIIDEKTRRIIACQSFAEASDLQKILPGATINPLGYWTGGLDVDSGATNRKLGSDMGRAVTGGGLHGKDLSKADVSVNIYAHLKALRTGKPVSIFCAIGDEKVDGRPYSEVVEIARDYITMRGGFEKFAEWGLIYGLIN